MDAQLSHQALQVGAHRVRGQLQSLGDLFPPGTLDQVEQYFPLARRESREQLIIALAILLIFDQQAQHPAKLRRRQPGFAAHYATDNAKKVIDRLVLPYPPDHTGADRGDDPLRTTAALSMTTRSG